MAPRTLACLLSSSLLACGGGAAGPIDAPADAAHDAAVDAAVDAAPPACVVAADCPGDDTACATRTCLAEGCGVELAPAGTVLEAQLAGDCQERRCDAVGNIVDVAADADLPDDLDGCTDDTCLAGVPTFAARGEGASCGVDLLCDAAGACVGCLVNPDCGAATDCVTPTCTEGTCGNVLADAGDACDEGGGVACTAAGACVARCDDGIQDGDETDVDCGGDCGATCATGDACGDGGDCASGLCAGGSCVASVNGCTLANVTDRTGAGDARAIAFDGTLTYTPKCMRIKAGQMATFGGVFTAHPLRGGVGGVVDASSPIPSTSAGTTLAVTFLDEGLYGYYCAAHNGAGMNGAVFVVP